jgi:hypothetical protein
MRMNSLWKVCSRWVGRLVVVTGFVVLNQAHGQPVITSTVPADGATDVSTTSNVVFTFSEAMDTNATYAIFFSESTFSELTTTTNWSVGNTVLTCTPNPAFPANGEVLWVVTGQNPSGTALSGIPEGTFTTGTSGGGGGGGGGSGTNKFTTFFAGTDIVYDQYSNGPPVLDTNAPYIFLATVTLASNRTALSATVTFPTSVVSNMFQDPVATEEYILTGTETNQDAFDSAFPDGDYIFTVNASTSNQEVTVDLPSSLPQPGAPQVSNFAATQSVNPNQPFTLEWDAFVGGTSKDAIYVSIGNAYSSGDPYTSNAILGTATSVIIPAGTLETNSSYDAYLVFYHFTVVSNLPGYVTVAVRESGNQFTLLTTGGGTNVTGPVSLTNASWNGHNLTFGVSAAANQTVTIQYNTSLSAASSTWKTLLTTNSATGVIQVTDTVNTGESSVFYRAQYSE